MKVFTLKHKDGTIWAKGFKTGDRMDGYWEWFRKDGTKLRSGHFSRDTQVGEWITYDAKGKPAKKTIMTDLPKIGAPALRALANAKIKDVKALSKYSEKEILALHGIGPSAMPILKKALKSKGLSFKK